MGNIPSTWSNLWDGPDKPTTWLALLVHKAFGIKSWSPKVRDGSLLKDELDLNDLFRPLTFLNSLCQLTARQAHCPMDVLICKLKGYKSGPGSNGSFNPGPPVPSLDIRSCLGFCSSYWYGNHDICH